MVETLVTYHLLLPGGVDCECYGADKCVVTTTWFVLDVDECSFREKTLVGLAFFATRPM